MTKNSPVVLIAILLMMAGCNQKQSHFISNPDYRQRVEKDLSVKMEVIGNAGIFPDFSDKKYSLREREALKFFYAYMPLSDIADYSPEFYLDNIRQWFDAPVKRALLLHTNVFGRYTGPEDIMQQTHAFAEINVTSNYVDTAKTTIRVVDSTGKSVADTALTATFLTKSRHRPRSVGGMGKLDKNCRRVQPPIHSHFADRGHETRYGRFKIEKYLFRCRMPQFTYSRTTGRNYRKTSILPQ